MRSRAPIRLISAGNQSGKTTCGAAEHAYYALGEHPYKKIRTPNVGVIVTAKSKKDGIQDEIIPKFEEVVGSRDIRKIKNDKSGTPSTINWRSGSVTYLLSAEQDDVAFESKRIHHWWIDEPVRRTIYIGLSRGTLTTRGHGWFTATPLDEPWVYDEIYVPGLSGQNPDIEVFQGSSDENRRITQAAKEKFLRQLSDDEIDTRWHGKFKHLAGRVFKSYDYQVSRIPSMDIPEHWPVWCSIDPHRNKPHAVLFLAVSPKGVFYVCNEIFIRCSIRKLAKHILDIGSQYNVVDRLIDTSAQEDGWSRVSAREMLQEEDVRTRLAQKKNMKQSGISLINQFLDEKKLFVMEHCHRTHREFMLYTFKRNKRDEQQIMEEPEKKFDDMMDNLRYILVERPDFRGGARIKQAQRVDITRR